MHAQTSSADRGTVDQSPDVDENALLNALQDDACRAIVEAVEDGPMSASEIADACDLPLSTTYRKVDTLTDAALLDERLRVATSGSHEREYVAGHVDLTISIGDGASVDVEAEQADAAERLRARSIAR